MHGKHFCLRKKLQQNLYIGSLYTICIVTSKQNLNKEIDKKKVEKF